MVEEKTIKIVTEDAQVGGYTTESTKNHMVMDMMILYILTQYLLWAKVDMKLL